MPFLETLVMPEPDRSLSTTVFRQPNHTDQYLKCDTHHNLAAKFSVINTLTHRAKIVCSTPQLLKREDHLRQALQDCRYPNWAAKSQNQNSKLNRPTNTSNKTRNSPPLNNKKNIHIVVPYTEWLIYSCKYICSKHGIQMHFKGAKRIRNLQVTLKDKDTTFEKCVVIYIFICARVDS